MPLNNVVLITWLNVTHPKKLIQSNQKINYHKVEALTVLMPINKLGVKDCSKLLCRTSTA